MTRLARSALSFALVMTLAAPTLADPQAEAGRGSPGAGVEEPVDWSIKPEISRIERSMRDYSNLSESLGSASRELQSDFERYLDDPGNELVASRLEKKMAIFADQVVQDFDRVIADQDLIVTNFKELRRKLGRFDGAIAEKLDAYDRRLEGLRADVGDLEQGLIGLSLQIKETEDEATKKRLKQRFALEYRRFRLKNRYVRGLERNLHNYQVLVQNLQTMTNLFTQLQDKFVALIDNLENEKKYLLDAIELQVDAVKIKKIMHDGIIHGERSIKNVTEQLAQLYLRVDAFTTVHDKINMGLGQYGETRDTLEALSSRIDVIGGGLLTDDGPTKIEDALKYFQEKEDELKPENRGKRFDDED